MADLDGGGQQWATMDNNEQQWTTIRGATCISDAVFVREFKKKPWQSLSR